MQGEHAITCEQTAGGGRWAVKQTVRTGAALPCNSTLASETRTD